MSHKVISDLVSYSALAPIRIQAGGKLSVSKPVIMANFLALQ
jgi:hypothetical protein